MILLFNIAELVTCAPLTEEKKSCRQLTKEDLGIFQDAWLLIDNKGKVHSFGSGKSYNINNSRISQKIDMKHALLMPGLVDSHTHSLFYGDRSSEFCQRLDGKTYQQIAQMSLLLHLYAFLLLDSL